MSLHVDFAESSDMPEVHRLRRDAYGRHLPGPPEWAADSADPADSEPGAMVLVCRDGSTGQAMGTARLHLGPGLPLDADVPAHALPQWLQHGVRAECSRLALAADQDGGARLALWKAVYWHCLRRASWLVMGARSAALVRMYRHLGCVPVFEAPVPLQHAGGLPHHILALDVDAAAGAWAARGHPMLPYMMEFDPAICTMPPAPDKTRQQATNHVTRCASA